jgi:hypothetical protein
VVIPRKIRSDRGTETTLLYGVHRALHFASVDGEMESSYTYGKSIHNQKIECFWSHMIVEWEVRWQNIFYDLESQDLWRVDDENDRVILVYTCMPIVRAELAQYLLEHNWFYTRKNNQSRLPHGQRYMNYYSLENPQLGVQVGAEMIPPLREHFVDGRGPFDPDDYIGEGEKEFLDGLLQASPYGVEINADNMIDQYLYLRDRVRAAPDARLNELPLWLGA